jgi:hypothetical protein
MPANDEAGANRIAAGTYTNEAYLVCIPHHNYICIAVVTSHSFRRMLQRGRKLTSMPPPTLLYVLIPRPAPILHRRADRECTTTAQTDNLLSYQ